MKFVKLPNCFFSDNDDKKYNLSASELLVFAALESFDNDGDNCVVKSQKDIAELCHLHRNTVSSVMESLQTKGIILKVARYTKEGRRASYKYYLKAVKTNFFTVPSEVFTYNLNPATFMVYCCIKCCSNKSGRAFPSLNKIANKTGLCVDTVISAINVLKNNNLLNKKHYIKRNNAYGCNNYSIINVIRKIKAYIKRKVACAFREQHTTNQNLIEYIIKQIIIYVKTFYIFFVLSRNKAYFYYLLGVLEKLCSIY